MAHDRNIPPTATTWYDNNVVCRHRFVLLLSCKAIVYLWKSVRRQASYSSYSMQTYYNPWSDDMIRFHAINRKESVKVWINEGNGYL